MSPPDGGRRGRVADLAGSGVPELGGDIRGGRLLLRGRSTALPFAVGRGRASETKLPPGSPLSPYLVVYVPNAYSGSLNQIYCR